MQPYIYFYTIVFTAFLLLLYNVKKWKNSKNVAKFTNKFRKQDTCYFVAIFVFMWLFCATRDKFVGTDTIAYVDFFHNKNFYYLGMPTDKMFELVGRFLHIFGESSEYFIFVITTLIFIGPFIVVYRTSKFKYMSLILFAISGSSSIVLFLYMSMIRQCLSICFFILAVFIYYEIDLPSKKKNTFVFALLLLAVLTHGSCLFTVPFLVLFYWKKSIEEKTWIYCILFTYVLSALDISFVSDFWMFIFRYLNVDKYQDYASIDFGMIEFKGWFNMNLLPFMAIALLQLTTGDKNELKKWYNQYFFLSVILNNLFYNNLMWSRLILYFSIFAIISIPNVFKAKKVSVQTYYYIPILTYYIYKTTDQLTLQLLPFAKGNIIVPYHSWFFDSIFY